MNTVCIHCGQPYAVPDQHLGQTVNCQRCGNPFTIAAAPQQQFGMPNQFGGAMAPPGTQMPAGGWPAGAQAGMPYQQPAKTSSGLTLFLILGGVLLVLLIGGGALAFVLWRSFAEEDDSVAAQDSQTPVEAPAEPSGRSSSSASAPVAPDQSGSAAATDPSAADAANAKSWTVDMEPEPEWPSLANRPFVIRPIHAGQAVFSGPESARVALFHKGAQSTVSVYDLTTATKVAEFEVPLRASLVALSPDGTRVVVSEDKDYQLWTISETSAERTGDPFTFERRYASGSLVPGQFLSSDKIFLATSAGFQMFSLPDWKPGYLVPGGLRAMSPGRKYLASLSNREVSLYDLETGEVAGQLETVPDMYRGLSELAFAPDGKVIAGTAIHDDYKKTDRTIVLWDLASGKLLGNFDVPSKSGRLHWCDGRYLLVGTHLVDTRYQGAVWNYTGLAPIAAGPDGRVWYAYQYGGSWLLTSDKVPDGNALAKIPGDLKVAAPILNAGDPVSLKTSFNASPPAGINQSDIAEQFASGIENSGHRVSNEAATPVRIAIGEESLGEDLLFESREIRNRLDERQTGTFTVPNRAVTVEVEVGSGQESWTYAKQFTVPYTLYNFEDDKKPGAEAVLNQRWKNLENWVKSFSLPSTLYPNTPQKTFGESKLRPDLEALIAATKAGPAGTVAAVPWGAVPDPVATSAESLRWSKPIPLGEGSGKELMMSHPHVQQAAFIFEERFGRNYHLARFHLGSGKQLAATEVTREMRLLDFRPDGQLMVVQPKGSSVLRGELIEIWQCSADAHETLFHWEPYEEEQFHDDVLWAALVGRNLIWTCNRQKMDLWTLPQMTAVHSMPWSSGKPTFSHDRRYMIALSQQPITYDASTGKIVGYLESPTALVGAAVGGTFSPDGKLFAALFRGSNSDLLAIWDFTTGGLRKEVGVPTGAGSLHFCNDRFLLIGSSLFDAEIGSIVWTYSDLNRSPFGGVGSAIWYFKSDSSRIAHLIGLPVPSDKVFKAIERVAGSHKPLLKEGQPLSLQVDSRIKNRPDHNERQQVREILTTKLEASGHRVLNLQDMLLKVNIEESIAEFPDKVSAFSDGKRLEVPNEQLKIALELTDLNGRSVWQESHSLTLDFKPLENHVDFDELHPRALQQRWDRLYEWLEAMRTPGQFYAWDLTGGIGQSTYGKNGEEVETHDAFR